MSRRPLRPHAFLALAALAAVSGSLAAQTPGTWRVPGGFDDALGSSFDAGYDLDGDGTNDFLVGLPAPDEISSETGHVQVLSGANPNLVLLDVSGDVSGGRFGASVAWLGDLDGDDVPDFAVGAPGASADGDASEAYVSIISGADASEIRRLAAPADRIYDGGFEQSGSTFAHPWATTGGASRSTSADAGMPVSGQSYLDLSTAGSSAALPPSNPGGLGSLPVGANNVRQDFRISAETSVLEGTVVFASTEIELPDAENDFMSVDVSADGLHRNVLHLDTNASFPTTSLDDPATAPVPFSIDLAEAFPASDTDTVFTVTISVGNAADGFAVSFARVDDLRLVGGGVTPNAGVLPQVGGWFGESLAALGDVDGDGVADLAVGAPGTKPLSSTAGAGSAYVFSGADGSRLTVHDGGAGDAQFGSSVACTEDLDEDGTGDWIVGSRGANAVGGAALSGVDGAVIRDFSGATAAHVTAGGDIDGDGRPDWIVGESENNLLRPLDSEGVPLFAPPAGPTLVGSVAGDLGATVEIVGDVDGDGTLDFAASSPGAVGGGRVTVFSGRTARELFSMAPTGLSTRFGAALGPAGDVNGDGFADMLVGDPDADLGSGELLLVHGGNPWHAPPGLRLDMEHDGGDPHVMSITAGAGEALTLGVKAIKNSALRPQLRVVGPLPEETEVLAAIDSVKSDKVAVAKLTLEEGGDYRIEILDASGAGGRYLFRSRSKAARVKEPLTDGADGMLDLPLGKLRIEGSLDGDQTHRTGFTARRGTQLSVVMSAAKSVNLIPGLRVKRVAGGGVEEIVVAPPATQGSRVSIKALELPFDGEYIIEAFNHVGTGGDYALRTSVKLPRERRKLQPIAPQPGVSEP